jgi:hypothetical protein
MTRWDFDKNEEILYKLIRAKNEDEVETILNDLFFSEVEWLPLGNDESNYSIVNVQQSDPINALCEKPVNSIDHILLKMCKKQGIDPEDPGSPQSMREAVEKFFQITNGDFTKLSEDEIRKLSYNIMIIADGDAKRPNITIVDAGEGQHPDDFENTLLSIRNGNKSKIKFVQGKYNMGGTGTLPFCGRKGYQLILSRKSTELIEKSEWGFTLVREKPDVPESYKTTWYEYFTDKDHKIFRISSKSLRILPDGKELVDGCFIKLYNYDLPHPSFVTTDLWRDVNKRLFSPALPILVVENRTDVFNVTKGKNDTKLMLGNRERALKNKRDIHKIIPINSRIEGFGDIKIEVAVFKHSNETEGRNKAVEYTSTNDAIYFTQNGQTHFPVTRSTFKTRTGFNHLGEYVMVHVDLSHIARDKSKIFMASIDRARDSSDYRYLEKRIFEDISENDQLKFIEEEYAKLDEYNVVKDSKINDAISKIIKANPHLWEIFESGGMIVEMDRKGFSPNQAFVPQYIPTFLKIKGVKETIEHEKQIPIDGSSTYIQFRTDASNDYFERENDRGELIIDWPKNYLDGSYHPLYNGLISFKLRNTKKYAISGDKIGILSVKITRPKQSPLECDVHLYYGISQRDGEKQEHKQKKKGYSFPQVDWVDDDRWAEFGWNETDIAKVDPDYVHINSKCKYLIEYKNRKPTKDEPLITNNFGLSVYFHALLLHYEIKDYSNYDDIFKKAITSSAKSSLLLHDITKIPIEEILRMTSISTAISEVKKTAST